MARAGVMLISRLLPVAVPPLLLFWAPVGGCGDPVQVDAGIVSSSGSGGGSGSTSSSGSSGSGSGSGSGGGEAGVQGACIVDVSCVPPPSNRSEVFLSGDPTTNADAAGWKFNKGDVTGAEAPTFDDSGWAPINVPHTWNSVDGQQGPIMTPAYYRGIGWYRRSYTIPAGMTGKRIYLQFDQSAFVTDAYVNGTHVGSHSGGKARFRFDITSAAMVGADNVIAVKVDNSPAVSPTNVWLGGTMADVAPISGDFTLFGGIQRDVRILATDNLAITPLDFGSPGVYLKATSVSAASATFTATVRLLNANTASKTASVEVDLLDEMSTMVQSFTGMQTVPAGMTADAVVTGQVMNPHLWNGLSDPYVYHVNVIVKDGMTVTDAIVQPFGFRAYALDPNTGFSLNGKSYPLRGVAMHQDHPSKGDQFSFKDLQYLDGIVNDFGLLRELGANFIRCAHDQHSDFTYSMADYRGLVTWAENAWVNRVSQDCATNCQAFIANTQQQTQELIRQNYNHPAILFWSMGNEILQQQGPDPTSVMQNLVTVAKMEDPTRTIIYAANHGSETNPLTWLPEATCDNVYFGWYYDKVASFAPFIDSLHASRATTPIGLSEYGAGGNPQNHGLPIVETGTNRTSTFQTEEYQAFFHEQYWAAIQSRPFLGLTAIWNMFDFASDYRNEGNEPGLNTKGLLTYDRSTKKDSFWFYKANWSQDPVVYITSRRYTAMPKASTTIKVYSNQASIDLTLNGKDLGMQTSMSHIFQWTNVAWATGMNQVDVSAGSSCTSTAPMACSDQVTWMN